MGQEKRPRKKCVVAMGVVQQQQQQHEHQGVL